MKLGRVACSLKGGASCVGLEEADSFSSVAVTNVVSVPKAFITSLKVGSDSSSDDRRSGRGLALFLILVVNPFLGGFMPVYNLGAIVSYSIVRKRAKIHKV